MQLAFYLCIVGMALLFVTLWKYEMASKHTRAAALLRRKLAGDETPSPARRSAAPTLGTGS